MGPDRSASRAVSALLALTALLSPGLGRAETPEAQISALKAELAATKGDLHDTQAALAKTQSTLDDLARKVSALGNAPAKAPGGAPDTTAAAAELNPAPVEQALTTARIAPVNADNPAISFVVDGQAHSNTQGDDGAAFLLATGELFISAPIDPFLRGYASINGTTDESFNIEEAALVTTALPYNLTMKGGRFMADFGRFPHWHDEALPFVDRPPSIENIIGGESIAEGVEGSWLAPTDQFIEVTFGAYNSVGAERLDDPDAFGTMPGSQPSYSQWSYIVRPLTYLDLTETLNLEIGGSWLTIPTDGNRELYGVDVTLRHQPGTSSFYQGTVVGVEWLWNNEHFNNVVVGTDPTTGEDVLGSGRFRRDGGYAYFESFFNRRFSAGGRFDYAQQIFGPADRQRTASAFLTWFPSEFQRLRFQFDNIGTTGQDDQRFTLQWTAFIGSHSHGFSAR